MSIYLAIPVAGFALALWTWALVVTYEDTLDYFNDSTPQDGPAVKGQSVAVNCLESRTDSRKAADTR